MLPTDTHSLQTRARDDRVETPGRALAARRMLGFGLRVLARFDRNKGWVLAAAIAYSALLSIVPLALVLTAALSSFVEPHVVLMAVRRELSTVLLPGQASQLIEAVSALVGDAKISGAFGSLGLLVFATRSFRVLQSAFEQIFYHRVADRGSRSLVRSSALSLAFVAAIGVLLLARIQLSFLDDIRLGFDVLGGFVSLALVTGLTYRVVPVGGLPWRASMLAGAVVAGLWEVMVLLLSWYFGSFSQVNLVYGSMGAIVLILLTAEYAASVFLLGAQAIAEVEQSQAAGLQWYEAPDRPRPAG